MNDKQIMDNHSRDNGIRELGGRGSWARAGWQIRGLGGAPGPGGPLPRNPFWSEPLARDRPTLRLRCPTQPTPVGHIHSPAPPGPGRKRVRVWKLGQPCNQIQPTDFSRTPHFLLLLLPGHALRFPCHHPAHLLPPQGPRPPTQQQTRTNQEHASRVHRSGSGASARHAC